MRPTKALLVLGLVVSAAVLSATAGAKNRPTTGNGAESVGTAAWPDPAEYVHEDEDRPA